MLIEIQTFRLRPDADNDAFLSADATAQTDFYYRQHGLTRRTTARSGDGQWLVVLLWGSEGYADEAAKRSDPAIEKLMSFVDEASLEVRRYRTLD